MKQKVTTLILTLMLFTLAIPPTLLASNNEAQVTLPSFNVYFNGVKIENTYRKYPLIIYKDITYFPMTYYDSRFLGIESTWDRVKGLEINKTNISAAYRDYRGTAKNNKTQTATIRTAELKLNGKVIRFADQGQYPFLSFRNVTYFPLTWNYAVNELGWSYKFDSKTGLSIVSANPQVTKAPAFPGISEDGTVTHAGYRYYFGEDGTVLNAPIDTPEKYEVIYQLPIWSEGDGETRVHGNLYLQDGELMLSFHQGGAVMGYDNYLKMNENGIFEEIESGYLAFRTFGNTRIKVSQNPPPSPNNLSVKVGGLEAKPAGDPAYLYGWNWEVQSNGTSGGSSNSDLYLIDQNLYLLAFNMESDTDYSRIHKVNLETNETTRVSDLKATNFVVAGKTIYLNSDGYLYRLPVTGGPEEQLNPGSKLSWVTEDDGYILCTFIKEATTPYTLIVYDESGEVIFKTSDEVDSVSIENGKLYYFEKSSKNVYTTSL